jgi:hypothetical protein
VINSTTKQPYLTVRELKEILARHDDDLLITVVARNFMNLCCHPIVETRRKRIVFEFGAGAEVLQLTITDGDPKQSEYIEDNE